MPLGIAAMLAVTAVSAQVATGTTGIDASGNYQSEVKACKEGRTGEDQATCLLEARNAQAAKKRGRLDDAGEDLQANALARCDVLKGDDKSACEARVMGQGSVSGSVAGGGLLREIEVVIQPPAGSSDAPAQPRTGEAPMTPKAPAQ